MTVARQIREVPDEVPDTLTAEAERQGQSVQAYLLGLVEPEARLLQNGSAFVRTSGLRTSRHDVVLVTNDERVARAARAHGVATTVPRATS